MEENNNVRGGGRGRGKGGVFPSWTAGGHPVWGCLMRIEHMMRVRWHGTLLGESRTLGSSWQWMDVSEKVIL